MTPEMKSKDSPDIADVGINCSERNCIMSDKQPFLFRPLRDSDIPQYSQMLYSSFNSWYWKHGWGKDYFGCKPEETSIFYDVYNDLSPGCNIAAFEVKTGQITGACFYHPRETHVSLGIMCVHQNYWRQGIGRSMVEHILKFTKENGYKSCRLVGSAINMNSFSLYNRCGFVPRVSFNDMVINVPASPQVYRGEFKNDHVRDARIEDVGNMGELEMEISGIKREVDYRYAIENPRKILHASVYENSQNGSTGSPRSEIDGFMISVRHPALNMLGPCVARSEETALALISKELERFAGTWALFLIPMEKRKMVEQAYKWGAVNVETHLKQVWGEFVPFKGVNRPSFLPETG